MRVTIPFAWPEESWRDAAPVRYGRRRGARNDYKQIRWRDDAIDIEIPSASSQEAPVVLRHFGFNGLDMRVDRWAYASRDFRPQGDEAALKVDFRVWEGVLYEPLRFRYPAAEPDGPRVFETVAVGDQAKVLEYMQSAGPVRRRVEVLADAKRKLWTPKKGEAQGYDRRRGEAAREVEQYARCFLCVDGVIHVRTSEPIYRLTDHGIEVIARPERDLGADVFRAGEEALLRQAANDKFGARAPEMVAAAEARMDPIAAELLPGEGLAGPAVRQAAIAMFDGLKTYLAYRSKAEIMAWDDLRSACYGRTDDVNERCGLALRAMVDTLRPKESDAPLLAAARRALDVYEIRGGFADPDNEIDPSVFAGM